MTDTTVKERPILFSGPMVQAIFDRKKRQTRRVLKRQPLSWQHVFNFKDGTYAFVGPDYESFEFRCPYGQPGDRLWVREGFRFSGGGDRIRAVYRLDREVSEWRPFDGPIPNTRWRPSIHMPRWASRLTLELTAVNPERLQKICYMDIRAEGFETVGSEHLCMEKACRAKFQATWDELNSSRGFSWESDPWVWVLSFKVVRDFQRALG